MNRFSPELFEKFQRGNPHAFLRTEFPHEMDYAYTDLQAQIGLHQLSNLRKTDERRISHAQTLLAALTPLQEILPSFPGEAKNLFWLFPIKVSNPERLRTYLFQHGVDTGMFLLFNCSSLACFKPYNTESPKAEEIKTETLFIPIHPSLSEASVRRTAQLLLDYYDKGKTKISEEKKKLH